MTLVHDTVDTRAVGAPVDRLDGRAKTTGAARYAAEFSYPDLAYAALVHATVSRGRIAAIDASAAQAVPGVLAVITHENAPVLKPTAKPSVTNLNTLAPGTSVNYLNTDEVHFDGQPLAAVVADTLETARYAASLVHVRCDAAPAEVDFAAAEPDATPQQGNALQSTGEHKGDANRALSTAPVAVDERYTTPPQHHNAIEPHATTAVWDGDRLTVHEGTQNMAFVRSHLALKFGIPVSDVRVISPFVGGAFGGKTFVWAGTVLAVLAARVTGRPVRLALTREAVYRTVGGRAPSTQRLALGANPDGRLTSLIHTSVTRIGRVGGSGEQIVSASGRLYAAENIHTQQHVSILDMLPNTIMRAPGEAIGSFALESAMDELAYKLGLDPVELRLRNEPTRNPTGRNSFAHRKLRETYALGADRFGWADRTPPPRSMRDGRWLVGVGMAAAYHPAWRFPANVSIRLCSDGTVLLRCGLHEMGMGAATAQAQIVADTLGVPVGSIEVAWGDSELPVAPGAGGSGQTASVAASVLAACGKLDKQVRRRSGEACLDALRRTGRESVEAAVGSATSWGEIVNNVRNVRYMLAMRRNLTAACGAHFCEVRVDPDTCEIRISRWVGAFDVGTVINAKTTASQLRGGIVMGIGMALMEETLVDPRNGRIMNPNLSEYHVPVHADITPIDVHWLNDPDPTMPLGVLGVGEVGIVGAAGAVANAVYHATGRRIRDLPITLDKLL
jgi:xanthine dehydrogenase YagR molybdenum-binding subunit